MHWQRHKVGAAHWREMAELGERMPVVIAIGADPASMYSASAPLPPTVDEFLFAGFLRRDPVRLAKATTCDLDVPADAEIVIEGLIDPELLEPEGPFGESHGHVALEDFNMSMQVTAITHRRAPVFVSIVSQVTPSESSVIKKVAYEPMFFAHLRDQLSIRGIRGVGLHEPLSNIRPVVFLKFAAGTPRTEVWRGLHGAATLRADCGKIVVAVSDDIDPTNTDAVFWSMAYRCNPKQDVHVAPYRSAGHGPKSGRKHTDSILLIDATIKQSMPPLALPGRDFMQRARGIWEELGLAPLSPQPPWHGYSLGDWDNAWDIYAERAVSGQWEQSGLDTFARRRGGLTPETPVREVEGKQDK
jgi:4-hydroxy-3-polyprenylbenzoate decarboxylase